MNPKRPLNILLADDGSQHAQAAVQLLQDLPLPKDSSIYILRAFSPGQVDWLPQFERSIARSREQLAERGFNVEAETRMGHAADLILAKTEELSIDLVVVGAKGLRSTISILLGGIAEHVMEHANCPVLIVRAPCNGFHKVLLAADGSPSSLQAGDYLARFPLPSQAEVHLLHVLPPTPVPLIMEPFAGSWHTIYAPIPDPDEGNEQEKVEVEAGELLLKQASGLLEAHGIRSTTSLCRGDAATEILELAKGLGSNLIVAGSRGTGHPRSPRVGSVARKLVHYSNCSVLLVKNAGKE